MKMKKYFSKFFTLTMVMAFILSAINVGAVAEETTTSKLDTLIKKLKEKRKAKKNICESVNHSIENIDNGTKMSITSDDEKTVAILHKKYDTMIARFGTDGKTVGKAKIEVGKLDNGIEIKRTSDDEKTVAVLQLKTKKKAFLDSITQTADASDKVVTITIISDDEASTALLQGAITSFNEKQAKNKTAMVDLAKARKRKELENRLNETEIKAEEIEGGVKITGPELKRNCENMCENATIKTRCARKKARCIAQNKRQDEHKKNFGFLREVQIVNEENVEENEDTECTDSDDETCTSDDDVSTDTDDDTDDADDTTVE